VFLSMLLTMLTACSSMPITACDVDRSNIVMLEIAPKPKVPTQGKMAQDLRSCQDQVRKDNPRKQALLKQLDECR